MRLRLLVAGAVLPFVLSSVPPVLSAEAPGEGRLGALEQRIGSATDQLDRKRGRERLLTADVAGYSRRIRGLEGRIEGLGVRISRVQRDLDAKRARLATTTAALRGQRARVARLRARLRTGRRQLARRLVQIYKADPPDIVSVVLNSGGFADLLERMDFIGRIVDEDRAIIDRVRASRADANAAVARLAGLQRSQQRLAAAVLGRRTELAQVRTQLVATRGGFARTRAARQRALASVRVSRRHLEDEVASLRSAQARIEASLRRAQTATAPSLPTQPVAAGGSGPLIWPVNGTITSPFCERRSYEACHPGLDIGVPEGTPIRAAAAGRVVLLQPTAASGGYGNYTCIQHTASMSSCYAHQRRFATSMGATVTQGQVIGYVGNTGHSFGAHLHFEVRINGAVTNPLNYL